MIGGPPIAGFPPGYAPPPGFVPPGGFASAPPGFVPGAAPFTAPVQTRPMVAMPPPPPRSPNVLARAKVDEEPVRPQPMTLPPPEQLGVARRSPDGVDWAETHRRLQELGAVGFQLEPLATGGYRFVCLLPSGLPDRPSRIDGQGATQAEAVRAALDRAAPYKRGRG